MLQPQKYILLKLLEIYVVMLIKLMNITNSYPCRYMHGWFTASLEYFTFHFTFVHRNWIMETLDFALVTQCVLLALSSFISRGKCEL